jgi:hypothetical protein
MNSQSNSLFHPATLTMLSGFAIIIATTIALGSMTQDQSGHAAAVVSKSFRMESGSRKKDAGVIAVNDDLSLHQPPAQRQLPRLISKSFAEVKLNVDPRQDFENLKSELERIVGEIKFDRPMQEIRVDLQQNETSPDTSLIQQICQLLATAETEISPGAMKIEIQTWAASPTPEAWVDATHAAGRLREQVLAAQVMADQPQYQISTSAGLWPHANQLRPAATIVLRLPVIY